MSKQATQKEAAMASSKTYSPFTSHNRELRSMDWDAAWEAFTINDGCAARYVDEYRKSGGRRGYHPNSRSVKCQAAFERGLRRRMRELDRQATGDETFCNTLFAD